MIPDFNPSCPGLGSLAQLGQGCGLIFASTPGASSGASFGSQPGLLGSSFGVSPEAFQLISSIVLSR